MSSPEEIAHQKEIAHQLGLLEIYRRNLQILLGQAAKHGGEDAAPLHMINSIQDNRDNIRRVKSTLRGWGEQIEDLPDDQAPTASAPELKTSSAVAAARQQRRAALEARLAALLEDQTSAMNQQNRSLSEMDTNRLQRTIDHLQTQIDKVEQDLAGLK